MNKPRSCGGGCCSSVVVEQPPVPATIPEVTTSGEGPVKENPADSAQPVAESQSQSSPVPDPVEQSIPGPTPQDQPTANPVISTPKKNPPSCTSRCCGGSKAPTNDEILANIVPSLPVVGPVRDMPGSPGTSSCQATICDDKCDHDPSAPGRHKLVLSVQGMDCPSCAPRVVRALTSFPSAGECHVDVFAGRATVTYHPDQVNPDDMARHVAASTGFQCQVEDDQVLGRTARRMKIQLAMPLDGESPKLDGVHVLEEKSSGLVEVEYSPELNPRDVLASFSPWNGVYVPPSRDSNVDSAQREVIRILILTVVSTILTIPVLVLAWAPLKPHPITYGAISLATTTIIQIIVARPIYTAGIRALIFQHTLDMDFLVSMSIGTAYVFSTVAYAMTVAGRPIKDGESYFETAALLVTLIMLGRLIAAYARRRSTNAVAKLGSIQSDKATLVLDNNTRTREIPIGLVHIGDILRVLPGELVPTDGRVVTGEGYVDESSITGESVPVIKAQGAILLTGTVLTRNISNPAQPPLDMRVTVVPDGNTIARMAELMRAAQSARLKVQELTDGVAGWLAPVALTIALVAFVGWTGVGVRDAYKLGGSERAGEVQKAVVDAIGYAVAIMVVSCPCALALCVPMVAVIAVAVGTRRGVLFKTVEVLENASKVEVVVFDKTGTLTLGKLGIESSAYAPQDDIPLAASEELIQQLVRDLTASSTHPVAVAVHETLSALVPTTEPLVASSRVRSIPGKGLEVNLDGFVIRGGNAAWAGDGAASDDHTVFIVSIAPESANLEFTRIAQYTLSDSLRPDSLATVQELTKRGLEVHILSGDAPGVVTRTASALGIPTSRAKGGCSPEVKAQWIRFFQTNGMGDGGECGTADACASESTKPQDAECHPWKVTGRKVMFVGDGTNDALALVQSDVSVSLGTGTDIASSAAHVVLLSSLSTGLVTVFSLAKAARNRIWINFGWAFVYNVVAISLASGVLGSARIPPQWAGLGELVSVVPVVIVAWSLGLVRW